MNLKFSQNLLQSLIYAISNAGLNGKNDEKEKGSPFQNCHRCGNNYLHNLGKRRYCHQTRLKHLIFWEDWIELIILKNVQKRQKYSIYRVCTSIEIITSSRCKIVLLLVFGMYYFRSKKKKIKCVYARNV